MVDSGNRKREGIAVLAAALIWHAAAASAQDDSAASIAAQANNPLANFTAFNVHDYYIGELTDPDKDANQVWMRYAQPFTIGKTKWLMRASLPVNTYPIPPAFDHQTGFGDLNVFAAYLIDTGTTAAFGIGPQITAPTASKDAGWPKWQIFIGLNTQFK